MSSAILSEEIKKVITESPFVAVASISKEGVPHLIIVGKAKEIRDDNVLVFGVYKMNTTKSNISETGLLQVAVASGKAGYRFTGKACVKDAEILLAVEKAESLL